MIRRVSTSIRRTLYGAVAFSLVACSDTPPTALAPMAATANEGNDDSHAVDYNSRNLTEYQQKWANIYGPLSLAAGGTQSVAPNGEYTIRAVPFQVGADYSVFDHLKYIAVSTQAFDVPTTGSLTFSVRIQASTPGTVSGRVVHGCYGAPFSYANVGDPCAHPWSSRALEWQQAGVVLNMINFATGQLFDWFVSDNQVFALIERLPSNVTNPALSASDPSYVGLSKAYTQIIKVANVKPGKKHDVSIRYSRSATNVQSGVLSRRRTLCVSEQRGHPAGQAGQALHRHLRVARKRRGVEERAQLVRHRPRAVQPARCISIPAP